MEVRETSLSFPVVRGSGPSTANQTVVFPREVLRAVAALRGYQVGYDAEDHHVGLLEVALDTSTALNTVTVNGRLGCRDWSGHWDDNYGGTIQVAVLAELASPTDPPPRGDLTITEVEFTQAVQYFHSADHLDATSARPDNSIPLIAGKALGVRAWVDYDASLGLPAIASLSGELIVRSGGATQTLIPRRNISPRRATEIDRGTVDHTLNFLIPGAWCDGTIDLTLRVFDPTASGQRSGAIHRTVRFVRVNPMRVYCVGVNYTGAGLNLPAPVATDFATTFDYTGRVWPTGDVLFSGLTTLAFGGNLAGTASEGCGDGFNDLLDLLQDMRGDTDDLVYGLLPTGTPTTGVAGCGGNGAGAGMVNGGVTAAHEAGHAVGRQHVPCDDPARCDSPLSTDDSYPQYGSYISDSTGEFGYDVDNDVVYDPAVSTDFMGYSSNNWISPYTYTALMAKGDPSPGLSAHLTARTHVQAVATDPPRGRAEWIKQRERTLFLRVRVDGDEVDVRPSFTFEAHRRPLGIPTQYEAKVLDRDGGLIACTRLLRSPSSCGCGCNGRVDLQGQVPLSRDPDRLVICRSGVEVANEEFEPGVDLKAYAETTKTGELHVTWKRKDSDKEIWYLLQWCDRDGTWRGVAPRTTQNELLLAERFRWATKHTLQLRLLAVERLTTTTVPLDLKTAPEDPPVEIDVYETPTAIGALITDPLGRQIPPQDITWYDEHGGEVGRGGRLARYALQPGLVRVIPTGLGVTGVERVALVKETPEESAASPGSSVPYTWHGSPEASSPSTPEREDW